MEKPHKIRLGDVNPHLICALCNGYYIDATTITECMHSFCKSCIVKYLEKHKYCPTCDVQVYKDDPWENLRPDETLQDIVYKMVPGLFKNEMQSRRDFYKTRDVKPTSVEDAGEDTCHMYTPDDAVSLSLSYFSIPPNPEWRRYFCCPAAVQVLHLAKLIHAKFGLSDELKIDILFMRDVLNPQLTLMEVMHVYSWRRRGPLHLTYRVVPKTQCKKINYDNRSDASSGYLPPYVVDADPSVECKFKLPVSKDQDKAVTIENIFDYVFEKQKSEESSAKSKSQDYCVEEAKPLLTKDEWKEVQLQISESGVMSFVNVSCKTGNKDEAIETREIKSLHAGSFPCIENITVDDSSLSVLTGGGQLIDKPLYHKNEQLLLNNNNTTSINNNNIACHTAKQVGSNQHTSTACKTNEHNVINNKEKINIPARNEMVNVEPSSTVPCTDVQTQKMLKAPNKSEKNILSRTEDGPVCKILKTEDVGKNHSKGKVEPSTVLSLTSKANNLCTVDVNSPVITKPCSDTRPVLISGGVNSHLNKHVGKEMVRSLSTINNTHFPAKDSASKKEPPKMAIVAPTPSLLLANGGVKNNSGPHKTLRLPPRSWNPTISRFAIPTTKYRSPVPIDSRFYPVSERRSAVTSSYNPNGGNRGSSYGSFTPLSPPRFFRMRNMPRYLGNPASGVKPMYQVASNAFGESKKSPEPSSGKKPEHTAKNFLASAIGASSRSAETPSSVFQPKVATSTSSPLSVESSSANSSCSTSHGKSSSSNSAGIFQTLRNSSSASNNSSFNFNHVSSSDYVSFADLCKNNTAPNGICQNVSPHSGDSLCVSTNQTPSKSFLPNVLQGGNSAISQAHTLSHVQSPGAFHLLPPSVDMIFKPQHRIHSSGGSRYQCSTPAVQRVPATNSHVKTSNQTGNCSMIGGQKTQVSIIPSGISQTQPNKHSFVSSTSHEQNLDVNKGVSDIAPPMTTSLSKESLPNESSTS